VLTIGLAIAIAIAAALLTVGFAIAVATLLTIGLAIALRGTIIPTLRTILIVISVGIVRGIIRRRGHE
jgi:hypothetical protein